MNRVLWMTAILIAMSCLAFADDAADRKQITAQYAKLSAAMKASDAKTVMSIGTPDMTYTMRDGMKETRQQMAAGLKQFFSMVRSITTCKFTMKSLAVKGNTAEATSTNEFAGKVKWQDGKIHKLSSVSETRDSWVRTARGWRVTAVREIRSQMMLDGRPFDPMAPMKQPKKAN